VAGGQERRQIGVISPDASVESPQFMWVMAAVLFGTGATIGAVSLIVPHPEAFDDTALWSNIAFSYAGAIFCLVAAPRVSSNWLYPIMLVGIVAVTRAAYFSGEPSGFYTLFYVWIGLYAVFFFTLRVALVTLAGIGIGYAWVLIELDASAGIARWVTTIGTVALGAFLIESLVRRVRGAARQSAEIAHERAELMATLAEVARTDDLTGLPNRRAWDEALDRELARAKRDGTPLAVGLADLDRFKHYNDDFGHQAGDRLLKQIGSSWGAQLRATDVLARYGGEEFALAFPGCDADAATALVERLRSSTPQGQTCSVGLVIWDGNETAEALFGRADRALYEAKDAGRDRVIVG
jgi:diguanylate cyclase (GGDEF)-like protein